MAEAFSNKFVRAAGIVTTYSGSTVGIASTLLRSLLILVLVFPIWWTTATLLLERELLKSMARRSLLIVLLPTLRVRSSQTVRFLGPTTAYTSPAATKSILLVEHSPITQTTL